MNWLLRRLLALWVRFTVRPDDAVTRLREGNHPVCYLLERRSVTDLAVLQNACVKLKLARPHKRLLPQARDVRSYFYLTRPRGFWDERLDRRPPPPLVQLIETLRVHPQLDVDLVPVAVYWGRAPQKEASWFRLLLAEDWALTSRLRKFFQVLFNGRDTLIEIGEPVSLRGLLGKHADVALQGRRVARALRAQYRNRRAARIGPDLSHRRTLVTQVLRTRAVRAAVSQEMREKKIPRRKAMQQAQKLIDEIAANYSHAFVRFMERVLTRLWNRLYDGVLFEHQETLERVAEGHEVVYVPCHRSHMDYLLLSYAIYRQGYAIPHIAAGINLNMPAIGRFLRKGGAFFIRRSFRGSSLYTVVFMSYLGAIMARGHSIEYFIEGGRSRTGRLLQPKTGMLSMTVRSYLREPRRPVVFLPVYFGYERIVEGNTYVNELSGRPKEKESVGGLLRTLKRLRERFGQVNVNIGEPIFLNDLLSRYPGQEIDRAALGELVEHLAQRIMVNINAAAAVTPTNLLAVTLLAAPRQTLPEASLLRQLDLYLALLRGDPYSDRVTVTPLTSSQIIEYGIAMKTIARESRTAGDVVRMSDANAVLAAYYRNNVLHLFALPSWLACVFASHAVLKTQDIQRLAAHIYPYLAAELFLRWDEAGLREVVMRTLDWFAQQGLIETDRGNDAWRGPPPSSTQAGQLSLLSHLVLDDRVRQSVMPIPHA